MKNKLKKITSLMLSCVLFLLSFQVQTVWAAEDSIQAGNISVCVDSLKIEVEAIKYKDDIYLLAEDFGKITRYEYIKGEKENVGYKLGEKLIIINKNTGYMQISCMNYTGSIAQPIEYNSEFYFSASELLPWLNVECYEQNGVLYVLSDALSFWEVLEGFTYQDYMFNLYEQYGDSVSSITGLSAMMVFDTFLNTRFDRFISADGVFGAFNGKSLYDYKCYVSVLSELAIDEYLSSTKAQNVLKKSIKVNKTIDKIESIVGIDEEAIQKDIDDFLWSLGTEQDTVLFFYDLMEEWQYLREAVASYAKISEYMDIFEVFKAYEITVKANEEYREHLNWLCDENTGNSLLNSAINEAVITLDKEYGVLFTFYMNLAKTVFSKVPSGAIKAITNNSMNQSLIDALSKITGVTDFIGSLGSYLAIAKVVFNTLFPVAEGYESMSKINVTEGIQDYSWELANELCEQDLTFDNLAHIRQSYIMALKSSRLCFKAQQETFDPFSDDNILSYKFDAIDEKTAEFVCSADAGLNDSIDGKKDFTKNLLDLFKSVKFYNEELTFIRTVLSAIGSDVEFNSTDELSDKTVAFSIFNMLDIPYNCKNTKDYISYEIIDGYDLHEYKILRDDFDEACAAVFGRTIDKEKMSFIEEYGGYEVLDDGYQRSANNGRGGYSKVEIINCEYENDDILVKYEWQAFGTAESSLNDMPTEVIEFEAVFRRNSANVLPFKIMSLKRTYSKSSNSSASIDSVRQAFVNAGKVYSKWRSPVISETDIIESADAVYGAYYAVQENVSTINDLRLEIKEYFTDEVCDELIGEHYVERNGKLYYDHWPFGIEDTLYAIKDELVNYNDELIYKVYWKSVDTEGRSEDGIYEMRIIVDNHNCIFEDYGIDFARLSGEINKLYLKGESYPTNKEINNMAIKTAYKYLVASLYTNGDSYCEYMIYDMDQDGTTELIYMKGTCMADLKTHYYTYNDGQVEKLTERSNVTLYRTETGSGLYGYWAHMGYETLHRIEKNGDSISEEKIFMNENVPTVEEYSPPDDKYLLETFQYNDHTGIERLAISN